jgi:hypothetical protein
MSDGMLSVPQLAAESNESTAVWRKRIQRRQIAFVKLGRNIRVRREDYARFIALRVVPPEPEQKSEAE